MSAPMQQDAGDAPDDARRLTPSRGALVAESRAQRRQRGYLWLLADLAALDEAEAVA